jgi:aquaporin Z
MTDVSTARPQTSEPASSLEDRGLRGIGTGLAEFELIRQHFDDPKREWRRLFSELLGTFFLVLAGAGGGVVNAASHGAIPLAVRVAAPGLMVLAIILFMGAVGGAHLNPAVSVSFAVRGDFPWRRVPGYIIMQLLGSTLACLFLWALFGRLAMLGATEPGAGFSATQAALIEMILTVGLVSVILGTASTAQNIGPLSAIAVGGYIILAGFWAAPVSGASMNPARSFGPDLVIGNFSNYWVYVAGPIAGGAVAVAFAFILRGHGDVGGAKAAQGELGTVEGEPEDGRSSTPDGTPSTTPASTVQSQQCRTATTRESGRGRSHE